MTWCDAAAESTASHAGKNSDYRQYDAAADYRKLRMFWMPKTAQDSEALSEWLKIAGYYRAIADIFEAAAAGSTTPFTSTAVHWMEKSAEALRSGKAPAADVEAAHRRLLALQATSIKDLKLLEKTTDATAMTNEAIEAVEGKPYPEALFRLLTCVKAPGADKIRAIVQRRPLMEQMIGAVRVNHEGKPIATREASFDSDDGLWDAMVHQASECQVTLVKGAIMPARGVFNAAYSMTFDELLKLADGSAFVPRGRELTYARGLHAGFTGDWMTAAHFLPSQIENSLRKLFEAHGVITSGLHRSRPYTVRGSTSTISTSCSRWTRRTGCWAIACDWISRLASRTDSAPTFGTTWRMACMRTTNTRAPK
jgi:hypothetical protein